MNAERLDNLAESLSDLQDQEIQYILMRLSRLDFDRTRRIANWLTHRRGG